MMMIPIAIAAIESEDDRAFMTDIYLRNQALMLKTAWQYTREPAEVEDIVSDSCVRLIQHLNDLKDMDESGQRAYILVTVKHKAIDACRKKAREMGRKQDVEGERLQPSPTFVHRIELQDEINMVKAALLSLTEREREVLTMKFFENKSESEIARELGVSESSVRAYVARGRNHLKAILYEGEGGE